MPRAFKYTDLGLQQQPLTGNVRHLIRVEADPQKGQYTFHDEDTGPRWSPGVGETGTFVGCYMRIKLDGEGYEIAGSDEPHEITFTSMSIMDLPGMKQAALECDVALLYLFAVKGLTPEAAAAYQLRGEPMYQEALRMARFFIAAHNRMMTKGFVTVDEVRAAMEGGAS